MNWQEYIKGIIAWSIISSFVGFWIIYFAADQSDKNLVVVSTDRLIVILLLTNALLTAALVKLSK